MYILILSFKILYFEHSSIYLIFLFSLAGIIVYCQHWLQQQVFLLMGQFHPTLTISGNAYR